MYPLYSDIIVITKTVLYTKKNHMLVQATHTCRRAATLVFITLFFPVQRAYVWSIYSTGRTAERACDIFFVYNTRVRLVTRNISFMELQY